MEIILSSISVLLLKIIFFLIKAWYFLLFPLACICLLFNITMSNLIVDFFPLLNFQLSALVSLAEFSLDIVVFLSLLFKTFLHISVSNPMSVVCGSNLYCIFIYIFFFQHEEVLHYLTGKFLKFPLCFLLLSYPLSTLCCVHRPSSALLHSLTQFRLYVTGIGHIALIEDSSQTLPPPTLQAAEATAYLIVSLGFQTGILILRMPAISYRKPLSLSQLGLLLLFPQPPQSLKPKHLSHHSLICSS